MKRKYKILIVIGLLFFVAGLLLYFLFKDRQLDHTPLSSNSRYSVQVYFSNNIADPDVEQCGLVSYAIRDVEISDVVAKSADQTIKEAELLYLVLEELLKGPTEGEKKLGFYTSINEGVVIQNIHIENNTAMIDFSETLETDVAGSCKVMAIRAQIKKTVLQFEGIGNVEISINGESEEILQP